jgi:hypothetical protein
VVNFSKIPGGIEADMCASLFHAAGARTVKTINHYLKRISQIYTFGEFWQEMVRQVVSGVLY